MSNNLKGELIVCTQCNHDIDLWIKDSEHCIIITNDNKALYFCNWECMYNYNKSNKGNYAT